MAPLFNKWHNISVERKVIVTWAFSLTIVLVISGLLYFSKNELHQSSEVMTENTKLRSATQNILSTIQKLEIISKSYILTGSQKDSTDYYLTLDSLQAHLTYLEKLINDNPRYLKYFLPLAQTIREELYKINHLPFSLRRKELLDINILRIEENIYKKLNNYWELLDEEENRAALNQIQTLQQKINSNLNYFIVLIVAYVIFITAFSAVIIYDVRKRKKLAQDNARNRKELETIMNTAPAMIFVKNSQKKFTHVNNSFLNFFNIDEQNILQHDNGKLLSQKDKWLADEEDDAIFEHKITLNNIEREILLSDSIKRWLNINKAPLLDENNNVIGIVGVMDDITKRIEFEKALLDTQKKLEELNAQKDKFFSIIAHDLRSPFYSLLGFAGLLKDDFDNITDEEKKLYINNIITSLKNLLSLIDNLLTWARINLNRVNFEPELISLSYIIRTVIDSQKLGAENKSILINNNCPVDLKVFADANMIEAVIRNLISNAIKFTKKDGKIDVNVIETEEQVKIEVKDNGIGMESSTVSSLLKKSSVHSTSGTNNEKGTGLGLMICKEFIEKHNGTISIESKPGEGTIISFTLPVKKP